MSGWKESHESRLSSDSMSFKVNRARAPSSNRTVPVIQSCPGRTGACRGRSLTRRADWLIAAPSAAVGVCASNPHADVFVALQKETPLANAVFWAAKGGNLALLQLLLNSGRVDADCRDSAGTTALMVASHSGHYDCVKELIMQGADINYQRETGSTALFFSSQQGHHDVVKLLLEFGASTEFQTKDGGTALTVACQYGHARVLDLLLRNGASVHDKLNDGATPLFLAAQGGHVTVIRHLLSCGAKVNQPREDDTTPLWIAAQMGHSEVVKVLLSRGADRDAEGQDRSTALFKAASKGHSGVMEELLKFSPSLCLLKNGSTALHAAVMVGNVAGVQLLLEAGADPALPDENNKLPADLTQNHRILMLLGQKSENEGSW